MRLTEYLKEYRVGDNWWVPQERVKENIKQLLRSMQIIHANLELALSDINRVERIPVSDKLKKQKLDQIKGHINGKIIPGVKEFTKSSSEWVAQSEMKPRREIENPQKVLNTWLSLVSKQNLQGAKNEWKKLERRFRKLYKIKDFGLDFKGP